MIVARGPTRYRRRVRDSSRLRTFLLCLVAALWLAAPATAFRMHEEGHVLEIMARAGQGQAAVVKQARAHQGQSSDCGDGEDSHGHLTSILAGMCAIIPEASYVPLLLDRPALPRPASVKMPADIADPPPPRPPRFA